jgi:N utilization substance protein B
MMVLRPETRARARALQLLYAWESDQHPPPEQILERLDRVLGSELPVRQLAVELFRGVVREWKRLDGEIAPAAEHWRLERLALVDRNILRLAVFELVHERVPARVAIDEALWLAHRFGGTQTPSFVNGVLDPIARSLGRL